MTKWKIALRVPGMPVDMNLYAEVPAHSMQMATASARALLPGLTIIGDPVRMTDPDARI